MECPKFRFEDPSDTGVPEIADAKKRLTAL
jgi:hypothetical protein